MVRAGNNINASQSAIRLSMMSDSSSNALDNDDDDKSDEENKQQLPSDMASTA